MVSTMNAISKNKLEKLPERLKFFALPWNTQISFGDKTAVSSDYTSSGGYYRQTHWTYKLVIGDDFNWAGKFDAGEGYPESLTVQTLQFGITKHLKLGGKGRSIDGKITYETPSRIQYYDLKSAIIKTLKERPDLLPKNWKFQHDSLGWKFVRGDKMDYHPQHREWENENLFEFVNQKMRENKNLRAAQKLQEIENKRNNKFFQKDLKNTIVTLNDSRRAGNCIEGSLRFAEVRFNIPRQEILNGGYIFKIPASKLVKTGDERAIRAAKVAWQRETLVMI